MSSSDLKISLILTTSTVKTTDYTQISRPTIISLICYIRGDDYKKLTIVKINNTETVYHLKEAIKEKMKPAFDDITAHSLLLWRDSIPFNQDLKKAVEALNLDNDSSLESPAILSDIFPVLVEQNVHIIIDRPSPGEF